MGAVASLIEQTLLIPLSDGAQEIITKDSRTHRAIFLQFP